MKKLISIIFLIISITSFSQGFPITQNMGSKTTNVQTAGTYGTLTGFTFVTNFSDTLSANIPDYIRFTGGIMISVNDTIWKRSADATHWIKQGGAGGGGGGGLTAANNGVTLSGTTVQQGGTGIQNTSIAWSTFTKSESWTNLAANTGLTLTQNGTGTGTVSGTGNAVLRVIKQGALSIGQTTSAAYISNETTGSGGAAVALRLNSSRTTGNKFALIVDSGFVGIGEDLPGSKLWIRSNNSHEFPDSRSGIVLSNDSSATASYVQVSPTYFPSGQAWDNDDAISRSIGIGFYTHPISGNTIGAKLQFVTSLSSFSGISPPTNVMAIGSAGQFYNASGNAGTSNQVLVSGGASAAFSWIDQSSIVGATPTLQQVLATQGNTAPVTAHTIIDFASQGLELTSLGSLTMSSGSTFMSITNSAHTITLNSDRFLNLVASDSILFDQASTGYYRFSSIPYGSIDTTVNKPLAANVNGKLVRMNSWAQVGAGGTTYKATNSVTLGGGSSDSIFARKASQSLTDAATVTWDLQAGINAHVTLGGARTLAFTNIGTAVGSTAILVVTQDGSGSQTLALPGSCKVVNGGAGAVTLTTTAGAVDIISFYFFSSSVIYVSYGRNFN